MTNPAPIDPLEAFPMPAGAIELDDSTAALSARSLAVAALQRALMWFGQRVRRFGRTDDQVQAEQEQLLRRPA